MACNGVSEATAAFRAADTVVAAKGSLILLSAIAFDVTIALMFAHRAKSGAGLLLLRLLLRWYEVSHA